MNIEHIAGICLSFLSATPYIQITFIGLFLSSLAVALAKVTFSWLKTSRFKKKIMLTKMPKFIEKLSSKHDLEGKIIIFQSSRPAAFCLGIKNPRIYLSTGLIKVMNNQEIEAIILHEKYHLIKRDLFLILFATFVKGLFFLFPLTSDIVVSLIRKKEAEADQYSISYFKNPHIVLSAFKKLLSGRSTDAPSLAYLVSFGHADTLEHRIKILKGQKTFVLSFKIKNLLITLFSFIAIASFFLLSTQSTSAHQNLSPSVCLREHNCHIGCVS